MPVRPNPSTPWVALLASLSAGAPLACVAAPSQSGSSTDAAAAMDANGVAETDSDAPVSAIADAASDAPSATPACVRVVPVGTSAALAAAIADATPGDCIRLADGDYAFPTITAKGTADQPIAIEAEHLGKARVATKALALAGAAFVTVEGLLYSSTEGVTLSNCDHCRLTRCTFHVAETGPISWIQIDGASGGHNRIDHNELGPKTHQGNLVGVYGAGATILPYTQIDHNYFHDVGPVTSNGWEAIRAGLSGLSHSSGHVTIEYNLFENVQGDPEIISTKSCDDVVRYNTLRTSKGQICLRIGSRNKVHGNFILGGGVAGTGGIRVLGQDHEVFDNYIEGVDDDGVLLEGGESEETVDPGAFHYRVYRANVVYNTIVNAKDGIRIGGVHPLSPVDSVVADNLIQGASGAMILESLQPENTQYSGNLVNPTGSAVVGVTVSAAGVRVVDPRLASVGGLFRLSAGSPAIDAGVGSFAFVTDDVFGVARSKPDVGAEEYSTSPPTRRPLTRADVGPGAP